MRQNPISIAENIDCMEFMARYPDKHFELAIVDPPYGIGWENMNNQGYYDGVKKKGWKVKSPDYNRIKIEWDIKPPKEYFNELFRVSKKQIIWGGNHFELPLSKGWIFWDKLTGDFSFGDGELAWTSFLGSIKKFEFRYAGMLKGANGNYREPRFHPTQKPIPLYRWLLADYAKPGDKILDTHLGSGSSRIAAYDLGFDFYSCELDKEYFEAQEKRFNEFASQQRMF